MKKLIAMVMTAAMVASLVPATAFAKGEVSATAKVVDAKDFTKEDAQAAEGKIFKGNDGPEVQVKLTDVNAQRTSEGELPTFDVILTLDNAKFTGDTAAYFEGLVSARDKDGVTNATGTGTGNDGAGQSAAYTIDEGSTAISNPATRDDMETMKAKYAGITTRPERNGVNVNNPTKWLSWADLESEVVVGMTKEEVYTYYTETLGYKEVTLGSGAINLVLGNNVDSVSYKDSTGALQGDFATGRAGKTLAAVVEDHRNNDGFDKYANYTQTQEEIQDGETITGGGQAWIVKSVTDFDSDRDTVKYTIAFDPAEVVDGWVFCFDLKTVFDKLGVGTQATVEVDGVVSTDALVYASIESRGITASTKKIGTVAVEEVNTMDKDLKIKSTVGNFVSGQQFTLKLSSGFEFTSKTVAHDGADYAFSGRDGNEITLTWNGANANDTTDEITIKADDIEIEATSAKEGAVAILTVKSIKAGSGTFAETAKVEIMKVVGYDVIMSVDEDADVPVIYSGVNVDNDYITDDSDHMSLEVTIEESFPGAWAFNKGFDLELPEGVYVTAVNVTDADNFDQDDKNVDNEEAWEQALWNAYQEGDHVKFEFKKRVFDNTNVTLNDKEATVSFELELVADPTFSGDVTLKLTGDAFDEAQEVTIAKFEKTYTVKAEQNDLKIDYRYTEVPTEIVVTEAEAGLWKKGAEFAVYVEKPNYIVFEDDPTFTIDKNSGMELTKDELVEGNWDDGTNDFDAIHFKVDKESDEAAVVTISDLKLFMDRTIPAGAYALKGWTSMAQNYEAQQLFAPDCIDTYTETGKCTCNLDKNDCFVGDVCDYSKVVKEAFVNVVTAGREQDDASFTTKVVVPVGENKIVAGETEYTIDAPAYINANGYTMLPVRAVAVALGINNNNVLWDQATKTVTILYGQRIITMQVGASVVYVNGAALPASSSVEITNNRTFLGLRDLATALGVTDITWDASTKTATLNGGNTAE